MAVPALLFGVGTA